MTKRFLTVGIHGFGFDPAKGTAAKTLWPIWSQIAAPGEFLGFDWYSYPPRPGALARAWGQGCWNRYYAAWAETKQAASSLCAVVRELSGPCNLMAHSLGTRVVLRALEMEPDLPVASALLISGADSVAHATKVGRGLKVPVLNVVVPRDDVLGLLGRLFTPTLGCEEVIGRRPIGSVVGGHWRDVILDDPRTDDHWDAYRRPENWPVLRQALV